MKPTATTHPTPNQLAAYSQGRLSTADHAAVEAHVGKCDSCCQKLDALPRDSLTDLVRSAAKPDGSETAAGVAGSATRITVQVPPELADHPRYRVQGLLGVGGMGAVFKAEHKMMERTVALKVINRRLVENEQSLERFRREVKTAAKLSHPNIVAAHDADQAGDVHFLVMEYVPGQSLGQVVERRGPLPVIYACSYIRAAALGLQHAHEQGMVHRDLKPQNLMLTPKGQIKVLDFGLARFASETTQAAGLTQENAVVGTPDYIAPEQATDARQADIRADIYSLGCTLYFVLTGSPPFPEGTVMQKVLSHIEKQPKSAANFRTDLPEGLLQVLDRMMAKDPAQRYQKPSDVAQALLPFTKPGAQPAAAAATPAAAPAADPASTLAFDAEPARPRKKAAAKPPKSRMPLIAGLAAAAIAGIALLAWVVLRVETPNGTLVIKTDDPDVQVIVKQDGKEVRIVDGKTGQEVELQAGAYEMELKGGKPGLKLSTDRFTLSRGDKKIVEVTLERAVVQGPPPATGPRPPSPATGNGPPTSKPETVPPVKPPEPKPTPAPAANLIHQLEGAKARVVGLQFSPDGRRVVACTNGSRGQPGQNAVRLWDVESGNQIANWEEIQNLFYCVAFSPDGRRILAGGEDRLVRLYDPETSQALGSFAHVSFPIRSVLFTPDGKHVVLAGSPNKVELWNFAERKLVRSFIGLDWGIETAALSADGKRLLVCGRTERADRAPPPEGYYIHVWDIASGKQLYRLGPHAKRVNQVAVSPDGRRALSCGSDGLVRLWDLTTGKQINQMAAPSEPLAAAISPDGRRAMCGLYGSVSLLHDADNLQFIERFQHPSFNVRSAAFSADGSKAVTGNSGGDIRVWKLPPTTETPPIQPAAAAGWKRHAIIPAHRTGVGVIAILGNGQKIITGDESTIRLWDRDGKEVGTLPAQTKRVASLAISPDGKTLASGGTDQGIRLWDLATGKTTANFTEHVGAVGTLAWTADGGTLASAGDTIRLYDVKKGEQRFAYELPSAGGGTYTRRMVITADGKTIAGAVRAPSGGTNVRIYEAGKNGHSTAVEGFDVVALSADGKLLATGGCGPGRTSIKLWNTSDWGQVHELAGHVGGVHCAVFHPQAGLLATGGADQAVRIWDVATGKEIGKLEGHTGPVASLAFATDGSILVSGSGGTDKTAIIWVPEPSSK